MNEDYNPCQCDGAGFCKRYGNVVTETMYNKCKRSAHYRQAFERFFIEDMAQSERNEEYYKLLLQDHLIQLKLQHYYMRMRLGG